MGIFSAKVSKTKMDLLATRRQEPVSYTHLHRCSPDRIFAGEYLLNVVKETCPELTDQALRYAVEYPWMYAVSYTHLTKRLAVQSKYLYLIHPVTTTAREVEVLWERAIP